MGEQASAAEVALVILFLLTCGFLITLFTESMLQAIEEKSARLFDDEDPWEGYTRGPGPRRR